MGKTVLFEGKTPKIHPSVFLAEGSVVIGDVVIGEDSSLWYNTVVRGDVHSIRVGKRVNIQDLSIVHVESGQYATTIGDDVTVGHRVILHGCTIGRLSLIGMGAIIMNGATIGEESIVGAGSLVTEGMVIPPRTLVVGSPAKIKRDLKPEELSLLPQSAAHYVDYARRYQKIS
ncbi:MAG: gamma carbonic anhydrase family protein [Deltaproteobacteria bacterium]|nr:gamma carbonic anhydrase family protein [Deltaproteobacteria bacterium]